VGMGYAGQQGPGQGLQQGNAAPAHFTKLYVTNIPPELLRIAPLTQHFEQFGEVVTIRLSSPREDGGTGRAIVQFRRHEDAKRALESPDAVCGNRFIKVFWARAEGQRGGDGLEQEDSTAARTITTTSGRAVTIKKPALPQTAPSLQHPPQLQPQQPQKEAVPAMTAARQLEIQMMRQQLAQKLIKQQKSLIARLEASKDGTSAPLSPEERAEILAKIQALTVQIEDALKPVPLLTPVSSTASSSSPSEHSAPASSGAGGHGHSGTFPPVQTVVVLSSAEAFKGSAGGRPGVIKLGAAGRPPARSGPPVDKETLDRELEAYAASKGKSSSSSAQQPSSSSSAPVTPGPADRARDSGSPLSASRQAPVSSPSCESHQASPIHSSRHHDLESDDERDREDRSWKR